MAELKEGTLKITITEAALKMLGEQHQVDQWLAQRLKPEYLAQCDKCLVFMAREEVGYRDESRTECRDCHSCDWRCEDTWNADITSGVEHSF
jgi:hypothetical protein